MDKEYQDSVYFFLCKRRKSIDLNTLKDKEKFVNAVKFWMDLKALPEWTFSNDYTTLFREVELKTEWPNTNLYINAYE